MALSCILLYVSLRLKPYLKLQIVNGDHLLNLLGEAFDLVVHCGPLPDSKFYYKKIGYWRKVICATPSYLTKHGVPKTPADLINHNCIDHYFNHNKTWRFIIDGQSQMFLVQGNVLVNSSLDIKTICAAGVGIAYLPSFTVAHELAEGKLISILTDYAPLPLEIFAVYPNIKYLNKKIILFIEFLIQLFK